MTFPNVGNAHSSSLRAASEETARSEALSEISKNPSLWLADKQDEQEFGPQQPKRTPDFLRTRPDTRYHHQYYGDLRAV